MNKIRKILVGVKDPSARSLPAVAKAAQLARALNASVELFHSLSEPIYIDTLSARGRSLKELEQARATSYLDRLERLAERLRAAGTAASASVEWDYPVAEALIRRAQRSKAQLIVAERHPTKHTMKWLLSYPDWELVRLCPVPLLLVKTKGEYASPKLLAAIDPGHSFAKPAKLDAEILEAAALFGSALGGQVTALHCYSGAPPFPVLGPTAGGGEALERFVASARSGAEKRLADALKKLKASQVTSRVQEGSAIDAIPAAAVQEQADIVVMGAVSRSGLKSIFIGNTAERVLDALSCDILVVKPPHFTSKVPKARRGAQLLSYLPIS